MVAEIAETLAGTLDRVPASAKDADLAAGDAGLALLFAYLGRDELAADFLDRAVAYAAEGPLGSGLFSGFPGIAWVGDHIGRRIYDVDDEDAFAETDEILRAAVAGTWSGDFDLVSGLTGIGVYALERCPRPAALEILECIVFRLQESAVETGDGICWLAAPHLLARAGDESAEHFNLGAAHGAPGVIALLAAAAKIGAAEVTARRLAERAVSWLLRQELPPEAESRFPNGVSREGEPDAASRLAWCYGDAGVAATLHLAARHLDREDWAAQALRIARAAARRPVQGSGVNDASLCHGSAGLAHLFNRLSQESGCDELAESALFWYEHTLSLRRPDGGGVAGYAVWRPPDAHPYWDPDRGFLVGAAGTALALSAGVSADEPAWDRLLLLSSRLAPPIPRAGRRARPSRAASRRRGRAARG